MDPLGLRRKEGEGKEKEEDVRLHMAVAAVGNGSGCIPRATIKAWAATFDGSDGAAYDVKLYE